LLGRIGFDDPAIAAQGVEDEYVKNLGAIGQASALDPRYRSIAELPAELGQQPRLADAGLTDKTDRLTASGFDLSKKNVQDADLALAVDENGGARGVDSRNPARRCETLSRR
jgi:hypothetical protein